MPELSSVQLALLLSVIGIGLLIAELFLPTHGILGLFGLVMLVCAIGVCFFINKWLGLGVFVGSIIAAPIIGSFVLRIWPQTPIGRRMVMQPVDSPLVHPPVAVGQVGRAISELRPMGEVEFENQRIEVAAEHGLISVGKAVRVVGFNNGKPVVRPA